MDTDFTVKKLYTLSLPENVNSFLFSPDNKYLLVASGSKIYRYILSTGKGSVIGTFQCHFIELGAISPDGRFVVFTTSNWNTSEDVIFVYDYNLKSIKVETFPSISRTDSKWAMFTPDSRHLVLITAYGTMVYDTNTFESHKIESRALTLSCTNNLIALAEENSYIQLYRMTDSTPILNVAITDEQEDLRHSIHSLDFSPDGKKLAVLSKTQFFYTDEDNYEDPDVSVHVYKVSTGEQIFHRQLDTVSVEYVQYSPSGNNLFLGSIFGRRLYFLNTVTDTIKSINVNEFRRSRMSLDANYIAGSSIQDFNSKIFIWKVV